MIVLTIVLESNQSYFIKICQETEIHFLVSKACKRNFILVSFLLLYYYVNMYYKSDGKTRHHGDPIEGPSPPLRTITALFYWGV